MSLSPAILDRVLTRADRDELLSELDILLSAVYQKNEGDLKKDLEVILRADSATAILATLRAQGISTTSFLGLKTFLESLKDELYSLPLLRLTLARPPSLALNEAISDFARRNIHPDLLLDIEVDGSIVAGAQVSFAGRFADYSLEKRIAQALTRLVQL